MMKRVVAVMIALTVLVALGFAGGGKEGKEAAPGITTIRYLNQETDPPVVAVQRGWVAGFIKENPTMDVILEGAPNTVINQTIATYVQAGAPLDVIHADGGSAALLAAQGRLAPIDDVVEALGGRDKFLPGRLLIYNDKVYSINQAAATPVLHYRKDVFDQMGLKPPTNWQELLDVAKKIHSSETAGIALPGGENRATTIMSGIFLWGNQGNYFDRDLNVTMDNPRVHEALRFYAELLQYAPPDATGWSFVEPLESFMAGRSAMVFYWHGMDLILRGRPELIEQGKVGVVQAPAGRIQVTEQGGRYISIFASSRNVEACKKWVEYVFRPENAIALTNMQPMLYPPVSVDVMALARQSQAKSFQLYGDLLFNVVFPSAEFAYNQIFHAGGIDPAYDSPQETWIINPLVSVVWNSNLYARAIQRVAYENWTPQRAAAELQKTLSEQVEVAKKELGL